MRDHEAEILRCVTDADRTRVQNILMRMPDKVCAVALAMLPKERRQSVYDLVAPLKAARIEEELRLEARRRTSELVRARIVRTFLSYFGSARAPSRKIWIRPKRKDETRKD